MIETARLLKHAESMSDLEFHLDFEDCVLPLCDPASRPDLLSYARRRRARPTFKKNCTDHRRYLAGRKRERELK